jgi:hypothetical protein
MKTVRETLGTGIDGCVCQANRRSRGNPAIAANPNESGGKNDESPTGKTDDKGGEDDDGKTDDKGREDRDGKTDDKGDQPGGKNDEPQEGNGGDEAFWR